MPHSFIVPRQTVPVTTDDVQSYVEHAKEAYRSGGIKRRLSSLPVNWTDARMLDLGCGPGTWGRAAVELGASSVTCQDASTAFLDEAQRALGPCGVSIECDLTCLPYPDGSFDVANCVLALHFSADEEHTVREVARVLKPGGVFYLQDHAWTRLLHGYEGSRLRWPFLLALPLIETLIGRKITPGVYTLRSVTRRRCERAGLIWTRSEIDGPIFADVYRKPYSKTQ